MIKVARVLPDTVASELGIEPGTVLRSVNGRKLEDFLDWEFLTADDELVLEVSTPQGEELVFEIERPEGMAMGIVHEPPRVRRCANKCEFCFIEGLPKGLRAPLYVRDDDYRLSFAYGNFATLSNVKDKDIARILEYRLSPLYISVHATPFEARKILLNNPKVPDIMRQLTRLAEGGIQFHCQMVIVPGLNDGDVLEQSMADLWSLGEAVLSTAIVPVGLTQFSHLYTGESMNVERANELIAHVARWEERALRERGDRWVFGSDELYMLARRELPGAEHYGDFVQIENGVGAVAFLRRRVAEGVSALPRHDGRRIGIVTGTAMGGRLMSELIAQLEAATGAHFEQLVAENSLFGPTTTAAGLLVGADLRRVLDGRTDLDLALIPAETINDDGLFLDDLSFAALREELSIPLVPSYDFLDVLSNEDLSDTASHLHTAGAA
jgi:putative radical SAM enzyme (TIGR03279 family)